LKSLKQAAINMPTERIWAGLIAVIWLATLNGQALGDDGAFVTFGRGQESCGEYLRAAEDERKARPARPDPRTFYSTEYMRFATYADGYLTGANEAQSSGVGQSTDLSGRMAWLESYCRQQPLDFFVIGLIKLRQHLFDRDSR
jgi:hypothetical protein